MKKQEIKPSKKQEIFFQEELDAIQELIHAKKYAKALDKIKQVKENTFWTMKQNDVLDQLDSAVTRMYTKSVNNEIISKMSKKDILNEALVKNKINLSLIDALVNNFSNEIDKEDIELYIADWLSSKIINNVDKYYVLSALKTIDKLANTKLIVYNANIGKPIEIVIKDWDEDFHNVKYYQDVFNEIEKYFFKNPSYAKFAESILDTIALWHFGVAPEYKSDKLLKNIIQYIEFLTQSKDIEDVEFFKWIESILRKQEI